MQYTTLKCSGCACSFQRKSKYVNYDIKSRDTREWFCSHECHLNYNKLSLINCGHCKKEFKPNTLSRKYCSQTCAAKTNNTKFPKHKKKIYLCKRCNGSLELKTKWSRVCKKCKLGIDWANKTLQELKSGCTKGTHYHQQIRAHSSSVYNKSGKPKICSHCGFNKIIHVAHIKSVKDFPLDTKLEIVNHIDNLMALCPNCHYVYDHQ